VSRRFGFEPHPPWHGAGLAAAAARPSRRPPGLAPALLSAWGVRLSRFVVTYRHVRPGEHVLYDVASDRYVGVDERALEAIARWGEAPPAPGEEAECARALADLGLLVADEAADDARLAEAERRAGEGDPGTAYVTLLTTLACNLACTYCIQKDHPRTGRMDGPTEAATVEWVLRTAAASGASRLVVHYIGGEPLLRKDFVLRTARRFAEETRALGLGFGWEITTNGVLLDVPFARSMEALGTGTIKVTLDGERDTHDAARVYRDGRGSFEAALAATRDVALGCPGIRVRVGGNFREGQEASYGRLLDRLEAEGLAGRLESVRFKPVIDAAGCAASCGSGGSHQALVQLGREAAGRGLSRREAGGIDEVAPCELHWERAWVVDPGGLVYKCFAVAGRPEMAVGSVRGDPLRPAPLTAARPWDACGDCPFVPVCLGGCIGGRYVAEGRIDVLCDRPGFERRFREEITRRYLEEFHPESAAEAA